ncbi:VOC family protein [Ohtaekwangia koreensis]|uniref:PhnB protein n=1 Tax=Ohtaekwangia koreensis TaxID=688867 RepID=A0A1T5LN40_9BACT|nr:VOC family protein [Ohtaekwangia koreensis]SKC77417.1 PhnB protein [Ohtaekwangia koreensis]
MATINPYLNFNGTTEEAFNFYRSVFGGEFAAVQRFKDVPETANVPPEDQDKIMHIALPIGRENRIMGTDALESAGHTLSPGNNFSIAIGADSEEEASRIFNGLSQGGQVTMPLEKTFWNAYFGMLTDKFGVQWMVNYDYAPHK